ncbi:HNH endonuclease [Aquamicrobium zhengzhouense]|uniref:HNH endonuclease n=1 Tax=Aquamicrobium zhengzhouense TaxID=2781738 RepID=A0ABS0S9U9_9HYPH|nr:HNH endonuclease signature motif containing protein [Aquamicrobium zhengzhouense]MBI1620069.1 HNH endonuclease [Aquamicrobium zhengzhouense]
MAKKRPPLDPVERHKRKMRYKAADPERYTLRKAEARARRSDLAVFYDGARRERKHLARKSAKKPISADEKRLLAAQRKHGCAYCGTTDNLHLDHIIPISRDGTHELRNVQWLCGPHNTQKLALTHDEYVIWCIERDAPLPLVYCGWGPDIEIFGAVSPAEIEISEPVSLWETILRLAA